MTVQETAAKLLEEYTRIAPMPSEQRRRSSTASSNGSNHANNASTSKSKRKSTSLPQETVEYLKNWMMSPEHIAHPYPTEQEKAFIMKETGIELKQLTNWFVNNRKRYWKPRVEARLQQQQQATTGSSSSSKVQSPAARVDDEDKNPFLVTPTRRSELIHVVSTPNVTATLQKVQDLVVVDQHAQEEEETGACPVVTESSGSSSESESVGLNYDALDDGSSAQSKEEEHATTTTRTVSAMPLLEAATTIPFPHDESATTDDAPPQDVETFSRTVRHSSCCVLLYGLFFLQIVRRLTTVFSFGCFSEHGTSRQWNGIGFPGGTRSESQEVHEQEAPCSDHHTKKDHYHRPTRRGRRRGPIDGCHFGASPQVSTDQSSCLEGGLRNGSQWLLLPYLAHPR